MKILIVAEKIFPDYIGGREYYIYNIANEFLKKNYEIDILTGYGKKDYFEKKYQKLNKLNIYRYFVSHKNLLKKIINYKHNLKKQIQNLLLNNKYDLIIVNGQFSSNFGVCTNIKIVYIFQSPVMEEWAITLKNMPYYPLKNFLRHIYLNLNKYYDDYLENKGLMNADKIVTLSQYMKANLLKYHNKIFPEKIKIVPAGIDLEKYSFQENNLLEREKIGFENHTKIILTVRRLTARMGINILIKAFKLFYNCKNGSEFKLVIVGSGPEKNNLEKLTKQLQIEKNIIFTGFVEDELLQYYYKCADLFVLPTVALEGFGLVTLESMVSGTPVIGTEVGGTQEVLKDFENGKYLVPAGNEKFLFQKISLFFEENKNIDDYKKLRKKCYDYVQKKFKWDVDRIVK